MTRALVKPPDVQNRHLNSLTKQQQMAATMSLVGLSSSLPLSLRPFPHPSLHPSIPFSLSIPLPPPPYLPPFLRISLPSTSHFLPFPLLPFLPLFLPPSSQSPSHSSSLHPSISSSLPLSLFLPPTHYLPPFVRPSLPPSFTPSSLSTCSLSPSFSPSLPKLVHHSFSSSLPPPPITPTLHPSLSFSLFRNT